jgi:ABC-type thiamin/hydroxymethylpyrimidine transport system permease subunit
LLFLIIPYKDDVEKRTHYIFHLPCVVACSGDVSMVQCQDTLESQGESSPGFLMVEGEWLYIRLISGRVFVGFLARFIVQVKISEFLGTPEKFCGKEWALK